MSSLTCLPNSKPSRLPRRKRSSSAAAPNGHTRSDVINSNDIFNHHARFRSCGPMGKDRRARNRNANCTNAERDVRLSLSSGLDSEEFKKKLISQEDLNHNRSDFNINLNSMTEHLCALESVDNAHLCYSLPVVLPSKKDVMNESNEILAKILGWVNKEQTSSPEVENHNNLKNESEVILNDNIPTNKPSLNFNMWHSVGPVNNSVSPKFDEPVEKRSHSLQQLGAKVEMVYNLISMLGTHDRQEMTKTLLVMSSSPDNCIAMRKSGCLPLLVQLLHGADESPNVKQGAAQALRNIVNYHADDKQGRREARVLRLLEQVRDYYEKLLTNAQPDSECYLYTEVGSHVGQAIAALMKLSFDEEHRHAMCQLGALQTISTLVQVDHKVNGSNQHDQHGITLRRYAGMTLTNLTFGDSTNKSLLCSMPSFMTALVSQLESPSEDLRQVTASVLRNLSWRADETSKEALRDVNAIVSLVKAAMKAEKESTLKSILSALWNFSAHSKENKADICSVEGSLEYLVKMLTYQAPSKTLSIIENAGGILRNISCLIAVREDYRQILRENNCLVILLQQLRSPSLTVVSNACGTLWNFSAHSEKDQRLLWDLGAVPLLRSLVHSKHKMISVGSSATLKNLLAVRPEWDPFNKASKGMPCLSIRKRRALEQELDVNLAETCDNIEVDERWDENVTSSKTPSVVTQYAETDLDQPTNYSLRYAEDDTCEKIVDQEVPRTYYTEGTPCNISSATSATDLRPSATDDKDECKKEEGESNNLSPAESLHSINHLESQTPSEMNDGKSTVLETPLMFSRASSLDSVSTPDHPDDRSSVVSEFRSVLLCMLFMILFSVSFALPTNNEHTVLKRHNPEQHLREPINTSRSSKEFDFCCREDLKIDSINYGQLFINLNVSKWLSLNSKEFSYLLGLQPKSFILLQAHSSSISFDLSFSHHLVYRVPGQIVSGDVVQLWNRDLKMTTVNILLIIEKDNAHFLMWYQVLNSAVVLHVSLPLASPIYAFKIAQIGLSLVSLQSTISHTANETFYNLNVFSLPRSISKITPALSLLQTLKCNECNHAPLLLQVNLWSFLIIPAIKVNTVHFYRCALDNESVHYSFFQALHFDRFKQISVSTSNGFGFIFIISNELQVFRLSADSTLEMIIKRENTVQISNIFPLSFRTWRKDSLYLFIMPGAVKISKLNAHQPSFFESDLFSPLVSTLSNLLIESEFSSSAVINFRKDVAWIIFPQKNGSSVILDLRVSLTASTNSANSKLKSLVTEMKSLQLVLDDQREEVSKLGKRLKYTLNEFGDVVTAVWSFESISPVTVSLKKNFTFDSIEVYGVKARVNKEVLFKTEDLLWKSLNSKFNVMSNFIDLFWKRLKENDGLSFLKTEEMEGLFSKKTGIVPKKLSGELIVLGFTSFYRLTVTETLNGYNVNELLKNIVRLDRPEKILGPKTFTSLNIENLYVNKIVDITSESLLFDDSMVDLSTSALIEIDTLNVLNNIEVSNKGLVNGLILRDDVFRINNLFRGSVHFEELLTGDVIIENVDDLPLILNYSSFPCFFAKANLSVPSLIVSNWQPDEYNFVPLSDNLNLSSDSQSINESSPVSYSLFTAP